MIAVILSLIVVINVWVYRKSKDIHSEWFCFVRDTEDIVFRNVATLLFGTVLLSIWVLTTVITNLLENLNIDLVK